MKTIKELEKKKPLFREHPIKPNEIIKIVRATAFYIEPKDKNIVYVSLKSLRKALRKEL